MGANGMGFLFWVYIIFEQLNLNSSPVVKKLSLDI